jgi:hypothetical protein
VFDVVVMTAVVLSGLTALHQVDMVPTVVKVEQEVSVEMVLAVT